MKSEAGATLTLQRDGSILASGVNPDNDVYVMQAFRSKERLKCALGRFRLSVSSDPAAFLGEEKHAGDLKLTEPWLRLAAAYAVNNRKDEALQYFGKALQLAKGYVARKPILELAARFDDVLSALVQRQPEDGQLQLALAWKLAERAQQLLAQKQPAQAQAELLKAHEIITTLRTKYTEPKWTVPLPTQMTSAGGTTLTLQGDGSILASGVNPDRDDYTLVVKTAVEHVTAIQLEALPDPSLPQNGPGRASTGNFRLNKLQVFSTGGPAALTDIWVAYDEAQDFREVIDGKPNATRGWSNYPRAGKPNTAILAMRLERASNDELKIEMSFSLWADVAELLQKADGSLK